MRAHIVTAFPEAFTSYFDSSIMKIARENSFLELHFYDIKTYSNDRIDDRPYGGGPGNLLRVEPIYKAITDVENQFGSMQKIFLGPTGKTLEQSDCWEISKKYKDGDVLLLCGHFEWVDERVFELFDFEVYSLGNYVLSSGELSTMVFLDSIVRLIPGVVGNEQSVLEESFSQQLENKREYPQYTRPQEFLGKVVPEVLSSGNHTKIKEWKKNNLS